MLSEDVCRLGDRGKRITVESDQELSILDLVDGFQRVHEGDIILESFKVKDSQSNASGE